MNAAKRRAARIARSTVMALNTITIEPSLAYNRAYSLPSNKRLAPALIKATEKGNKFQERLTKANNGHEVKPVRRQRLHKGTSSFLFIQEFDQPLTLRLKKHRIATIEKRNVKGQIKPITRVERQDLSATLTGFAGIRINLKSSKLPKWFR